MGNIKFSYGVNNNRDWDEAVKYGFISAGGGPWYTGTLKLLEPGARIWVNVPGEGYVGVGEVADTATVIDDFRVTDDQGKQVNITALPVKAAKGRKAADDPERAEFFVRVKWLKTVLLKDAIKEKGFFGNQNSVAKPKTPRWNHTVERLKKRFGID
jgi:hypothetical protein